MDPKDKEEVESWHAVEYGEALDHTWIEIAKLREFEGEAAHMQIPKRPDTLGKLNVHQLGQVGLYHLRRHDNGTPDPDHHAKQKHIFGLLEVQDEKDEKYTRIKEYFDKRYKMQLKLIYLLLNIDGEELKEKGKSAVQPTQRQHSQEADSYFNCSGTAADVTMHTPYYSSSSSAKSTPEILKHKTFKFLDAAVELKAHKANSAKYRSELLLRNNN